MSKAITDQMLKDTLGQNKLVILDFWASWCGPCRMLAPVIDELSKDNPNVVVGKVDISDNPNSTTLYGITGIPCVIFFKDGEEVGRVKGVMPKAAFQKKINELFV